MGSTIQRRRIVIQGIVQGVGFRPFVYGQALRRELAGFVLNDSSGVTIEIEGTAGALDDFQRALHEEAPPLACIDSVVTEVVLPLHESAFIIAHSEAGTERHALISPDTATCDDCLRELFDPFDRRYGYPFINCTNCGPRFTIVQDVPYDRNKTTMRVFPMCPACQAEYDDPSTGAFMPSLTPALSVVPMCASSPGQTCMIALLLKALTLSLQRRNGSLQARYLPSKDWEAITWHAMR